MTAITNISPRRRAAGTVVGGLVAALTITGVPGDAAGAAAARAGDTPVRLTPDDVVLSGYPNRPVRVGDALYYQAYTEGTDDREVWRTTDDGVTEQVTDIDPDHGSQPGFFTAAGDLLLYAANDGTTGGELWQTDTSTGETTRLTDLDDIPPKPPTHGSQDEVDGSTNPAELTVVGDTLYFRGDDGHTGRELWQTDLTTGKTTQTADLRPGGPYSDSGPYALTVVGDDLYFVARGKGVGYQIWRHDTRTGQTEQVTHVEGQAGAYYDSDADNGVLPVAHGSLFFSGSDDAHGGEPWSLDLATGRAHRLADINPGPDGSAADEATLVGHRLFFSARDGRTGQELWQTNVRNGKTRQRADLQPGGHGSGSFPQELTRVGHVLYFSARARGNDQELWRTSPGRPGVEQVADINPGAEGSWPVYLVAVGQDLYFRPTDVGNGAELWRAGPDGADLVADIAEQPGPGDARIDQILDDEGRLVFAARDGLWALE